MWTLWLALASADDGRGTILVTVDGLRNDRGVVHVALYDGPAGFPADGRGAFRSLTVTITDGRAACSFGDVPYGTYAIGFLHDENGDEVMQKTIFGAPKEGYGASNDARGGFGPPRYEDAVFRVDRPVVEQAMTPVYWF